MYLYIYILIQPWFPGILTFPGDLCYHDVSFATPSGRSIPLKTSPKTTCFLPLADHGKVRWCLYDVYHRGTVTHTIRRVLHCIDNTNIGIT